MKTDELEYLLSSLIPKLYSFAFAMMQEESMAEQIIIDAYSVLVVKDREFIENYKYEDTKKEKVSFKRYLFINLLREIFEMSLKRKTHSKYLIKRNFKEYNSFYSLDNQQKAVLFLKENFEFSIEMIQETLQLEKHQVVENLYNSRQKLLDTDVSLSVGEL